MRTMVVGSVRPDAGKTSLITGLGLCLDQRIGYMKPLGDRLFYRKKRLWDYDSAIVVEAFGLEDMPEEMSIGFEHTKLRFMYDAIGIQNKLQQLMMDIGADKDTILVESGKSLAFGSSLLLDPISIARILDAPLILIVSGDENNIIDDIFHVTRMMAADDIDIMFILNKVPDVDEFDQTYMEDLKMMGVEILGSIPYYHELTSMMVGYLNDRLFGKVLAGDSGKKNKVSSIFVGAMSADAAIRQPEFNTPGKLIITSGDRTDMIVAALDSDTSAVILTNNLVPPANLISKAESRGIPLILVTTDTFETAKLIHSIEPLMIRGDKQRHIMLKEMVRDNVDMDKIRALIEGGGRSE